MFLRCVLSRGVLSCDVWAEITLIEFIVKERRDDHKKLLSFLTMESFSELFSISLFLQCCVHNAEGKQRYIALCAHKD